MNKQIIKSIRMITSLKTVADGRCLWRIQTPSNWYSMIDQTDVLKVRHPRYLSTKNTRPGQKDAATETRKPENEKTRKPENENMFCRFCVFVFPHFRSFAFSCFMFNPGVFAFRYILYTCPKLWSRSCSKCYRMDCFGAYFTHCPTPW